MKTLISILFVVAFFRSYAQDAVILDRNSQLFASINEKPVAFASNTFDVYVNKATGEFNVSMPIDDIYIAITNPDLRVTGENKGKYLNLHAIVPVNDVLNNNSAVVNMKIETTVTFNNIDYQTSFNFSILRIQPRGFSVMMNGTFPHSVFEIKNLSNAKDELGLQLSFTGY